MQKTIMNMPRWVGDKNPVDQYKAWDGTYFDHPETCKEYEELLSCAMKACEGDLVEARILYEKTY